MRWVDRIDWALVRRGAAWGVIGMTTYLVAFGRADRNLLSMSGSLALVWATYEVANLA